MSERRNLIVALGVSVLSLGLAALLSYAVALGAQGKRFDWGSPIVPASVAVMAIGVALIVVVLVRFAILTCHRTAISEFMGRGNALLAEYQTRGHSGVEQRQREWTGEVQAWLDDHMKHYRSHFDNVADARDDLEIGALYLAYTQAQKVPVSRAASDRARTLEEEELRKRLLRLKDIMTDWR
jgi:hypothetical protein